MNGDICEPIEKRVQVKVLAVGITQQVRLRATSNHPVTGSETGPFDPSTEGIVQDETTGDMYYAIPNGACLLSERINIAKDKLIKLSPNTNPIRAAALLGPWLTGLSLLLHCQGRKVLIVGVTTCNGRAAAVIARWLGASAIIGLSDDNDALMTVPGLTIRTHITKPIRLPKLNGINIILDFIGGETGIQVIAQTNNAPEDGAPINFRSPKPKAKPLLYSPAWGPRGGEPFVVDSSMMVGKNLQILDPALSLWRLTSSKMRNTLRLGLRLMERLETTPYDIMAKPMAEVESFWDEEDIKSLKKMLVLLPSKAGPKVVQQPLFVDDYMDVNDYMNSVVLGWR